MRRSLVPISALLLVACGPKQHAPPTVLAPATPAGSSELPHPATPSSITSFDTCPGDTTTTPLLVGEQDLFWACSNGIVGHRSFATGAQETVMQIPGQLWLALDGGHLYVSHETSAGTATLLRVPRDGGPIATVGIVPPGRMVVDGSSAWIGVRKSPPPFAEGLYRVSLTGGVAKVVVPGDAVAIGREGSTIAFVETNGSFGRWTLSTLDASTLTTKRIRDFAKYTAVAIGGDYAYIGASGVNLKSGKSTDDLPCSEVVAATKTRVLVRCTDKTVQVANHGSDAFTTLPEVPKTDQPLFAGPRHICWLTGKLRDTVQCVPY